MHKPTRNAIERATQRARKLLEAEVTSQLEGTFDVLGSGTIAPKGGPHLSEVQQSHREQIVAAIEHKKATGMSAAAAVADYLRDAAFTTLNRFVALKMLEARELVQPCITRGELSPGYHEFCGMAPGVALLPKGAGYRLYVECLFDELSTEIKVLFDRRDASSILWPGKQTFDDLLVLLNAPELASVWSEDETIGWVYQFFNSGDERKRMREESQAPRNSRELAVRNQFFTPRYVVQFLTDNTLGRTWYKMRGGKTRLAEFCKFLVKPSEEPLETRPLKDPRDLRVLDPACGSGHFLLYSFDLLLEIYEEAWEVHPPVRPELVEGPPRSALAPKSQLTGRTLLEDYPDLEALRLAAPALILENNLHGVDIDPRCAQIAALALWLRAQRAWKDAGVPASRRPRVDRTHIVIAEPMPGDAALIEDFAERLELPLLRELFRKMVGEFRLAGELGTLLRVEDGIALELTRAREQFVKQRENSGFIPGLEPKREQGTLDFSGIDDDSFFHEAEGQIVKALRDFAEMAAGGANVRRRLFAGDASHGIALLDLARTRFDVVLMNPPFGAGSLGAKKEFEKSYPRTKNDVYAAFVERGVQLLHPHGMLGAITSRTGFFLSSFQKWREEILLKEAPPVVFADLGLGVLDSAMVEVAAYCLERETKVKFTRFLRLMEQVPDDKGPELMRMAGRLDGSGQSSLLLSSYSQLPGSPFAYWLPPSIRSAYGTCEQFEKFPREARRGSWAGNDFRYLRLWQEVPCFSIGRQLRWTPFAKGGEYSLFYADLPLLVDWDDSRRTFRGFFGRPGRETERPESLEYYFRSGLTWPLRTQRGFNVRVLPEGSVFANVSPCIFEACASDLWPLLALVNSGAFATLISALHGWAAFQVGVIQHAPVPRLLESDRELLAFLARRAWSLKRSLDTCTENSHAFVLPALLQVAGESGAARASAWASRVASVDAELATIQSEIDDRCFDLYGIDEADRRAITEGFGNGSNGSAGSDESPEHDGTDCPSTSSGRTEDEAISEAESTDDDDDAPSTTADTTTLAVDLVCWATGVAFGRFDIRLATGARAIPPEPEPFDPLPVCSPGMLTGEDGLPLEHPPAGYLIRFPEDGILIDDPGHASDLTAAVRAVFDTVFSSASTSPSSGQNPEIWWNDISALLDPKSSDLRSWLASSFFEHHLKRYSKSRRKAPIFWQLGTKSGRTSLWLYAHRMRRDSLLTIQNEHVGPKLALEENRLTSLRRDAGSTPSSKARRSLAAQESLVDELREMLDEVKRVAPLWNPTLDDGVVVTMAPLWRLVPQHKPWQKELAGKWKELAAGSYDWAHLAMHLWPERVVPKCASDRSLAIAHGLEEIFWTEGPDGKWKARATPARPIEDMVRERSSPAVKAALKSLMEAPGAVSGRRRKGVSDA